MTGEEVRTLTTNLLGGIKLGDTEFLNLAEFAKDKIEGRRSWMMLRTEDSSNTAAASDLYTTAKTLPSDFLRTFGSHPVVLVNDAGDVIEYDPSPFNQRHQNKEKNRLFYIDLKNNNFFLIGSLSGSYTIYLYYIASSTALTLTNSWVFPDFAHGLLAFEIALMYKGEVDYDEIHARMARFHGVTVGQMNSSLIKWDDELQRLERNV